jgi:hypothetical protein
MSSSQELAGGGNARAAESAPAATNAPETAAAGRLQKPLAVFAFFMLVYTLTWGGHYTSGDGAEKVAWARAMIFHASADIDPGPGVAYTKYGVGHALFAAPAMAAAHLIRSSTGIRCEAALYTFMFVVNGAFFLYLVARYLWRDYSPKRVWATVLILGLATTWWPHKIGRASCREREYDIV